MSRKRQASKSKRPILKGRAVEASGLPRLCEMCSTEVAKDWYQWRGVWLCNRCWPQRIRS